MIRKGTRYPRQIWKGTRAVQVLTKGDRPIWMSPQVQQQVLKIWLDANVVTTVAMTEDADAFWFELEVILPGGFSGGPDTGWTGPMVEDKPDVTLGLFWSDDLATWSDGGWIDSPGVTNPETLGDGRKKWVCRYSTVPRLWTDIMVDLTASTDRYGKSITAISVKQSAVSLPNYPYAMPADAATLQADLRDAGFDGALVTSTSSSMVATAKNHTPSGVKSLDVTMSGSNVTDVKSVGVSISLPSYPYAMPGDAATLQADLRSAGFDGAVVMLHDDPWTVFLPDVVCVAGNREFSLAIDPGDPYPGWNFFGDYVGENPADQIEGTSGNLRTPLGDPLQEANRAFARLGFIVP